MFSISLSFINIVFEVSEREGHRGLALRFWFLLRLFATSRRFEALKSFRLALRSFFRVGLSFGLYV